MSVVLKAEGSRNVRILITEIDSLDNLHDPLDEYIMKYGKCPNYILISWENLSRLRKELTWEKQLQMEYHSVQDMLEAVNTDMKLITEFNQMREIHQGLNYKVCQ